MPLNAEFESILKSLVDSIQEDRHLVGSEEMVEILNKTAEYLLDDPEKFSLHATLSLVDPMRDIVNEAATKHIAGYDELDSVTQWRLKALWRDYQRVEGTLSGLFATLGESMVCSYDYARFVIRRYERFVRGDAVESLEFPPEGEREWYMPVHGDAFTWFSVVFGILFNKFTREYVDAICLLDELYAEDREQEEGL